MNQKHFNTSIYITDQQIGIYHYNTLDASKSVAADVLLDEGTIESGYIKNPISLYKNLKKAFKLSKVKPKKIQWVIPDANVLIREVQVLKMDLEKNDIDTYLDREMGYSIKYPFEEATYSYVIQQETEIDFHILLYISDRYLIEDYLDIFEKCRIKEIQYGLVSSSVSKLLNGKQKMDDNSLVVSLYDHLITINIIENQSTIFGMIDEFSEKVISINDIEEYVERIANYYQYNLRKGKQAIQHIIVLDVSNENAYFTKMKSLKDHLTEKFTFLFIDFKMMNPSLKNYRCNVDIAYLSSSTIKDNDTTPLGFQIERHKAGLIIANYLLVLTVAVFAFTSLIYIPFMNMQSEVNYQESINQALTIQRNMLQNSIDYSNTFTNQEIIYNETFTYLDTHDNQPFDYLLDMLALLNADITLTNVRIDQETKMIEFNLQGTSRLVLYEYIIDLYETHGVLTEPTNQKWIVLYPETNFTASNSMRVVIYYA